MWQRKKSAGKNFNLRSVFFIFSNSLWDVILNSIVLYLKGAQSQLDVESGSDSSVLGQEGKYSVVHPKQRN